MTMNMTMTETIEARLRSVERGVPKVLDDMEEAAQTGQISASEANRVLHGTFTVLKLQAIDLDVRRLRLERLFRDRQTRADSLLRSGKILDASKL